MDFFRIFKRSSGEKAPAQKQPQASNGPRGGASFVIGGGASPMSVAAVYRCVNLLADSVANLPLRYMRRKNGVFTDYEESRLSYLLGVQPCQALSAVDFWAQLVRYVLLEGNAYVVPVYDPLTAEVERLALPSPSSVAHDVTTDTYTIYDPLAGVSGVYSEDEVIHVKNYSPDGKTGVSTLAFARMSVGIAQAGDAETLNRFSNGGDVRGIVSNDTSVRGFGEYQDNELQKTANSLDDRFRNGERIVSLPGQVQFSPISLTAVDLQFLENRKFSVPEICRFFGVHPSFVFSETSNNYKSAEMANVAFLSNTLNPLLKKIENEFSRKLIPEAIHGKRKIEFDRRGLYACDLESRVKYQAATIAAGIYSVNDWRAIENKEAVEGGDAVLVSANLKAINEINSTNT